MRRLILIIVLAQLALACQTAKRRGVSAPAHPISARPASTPQITFEGSRGETCDDPVVIIGAQGSSDGVRAEYRWIAERFPGYRTKGQALVMKDGKSFDLVTFETPRGETKEVCFDITEFFGKF